MSSARLQYNQHVNKLEPSLFGGKWSIKTQGVVDVIALRRLMAVRLHLERTFPAVDALKWPTSGRRRRLRNDGRLKLCECGWVAPGLVISQRRTYLWDPVREVGKFSTESSAYSSERLKEEVVSLSLLRSDSGIWKGKYCPQVFHEFWKGGSVEPHGIGLSVLLDLGWTGYMNLCVQGNAVNA